MDESIPSRQNLLNNLKRLAAQRHLYTQAKRLVALQLFFNIPVIIVLSVSAWWLNRSNASNPVDISWLVATAGVIFTLVGMLVLSPRVEKLKERAAKIQELFDVDVLKLSWNQITVGDKPNYEEIHLYSDKYARKEPDFASLKDWYAPQISAVPDDAGRIMCQRANLFWDAELRNKFTNYIVYSVLILFIVLLVCALFQELSFRLFLLNVAAPMLPLVSFAIDQRLKNSKAQTKRKPAKSSTLRSTRSVSGTARTRFSIRL